MNTNKFNRVRNLAIAMIAGLVLAWSAQAASFDCSKAGSKIEHFICDNPEISKLDDEIGQAYQDVLSKANDEEKKRVKTEQIHWLKLTRNACDKDSCFKQAYWSRLAALKTFFAPHAPIYKHESDKADTIKHILASAPLYPSNNTPFCNQIFEDLKQMKDVHFVDPIVQTQSYEDPALDPWKSSGSDPLNFTYTCFSNDYTPDHDLALRQCSVEYGLPPFKLFELPTAESSGKKRYYFYFDSFYGPMNLNMAKTRIEERSEFKELNVEPDNVFPQIMVGKPSYNSIIEYQNNYYFLTLFVNSGADWLNIDSVNSKHSENKQACRWTPAQSTIPVVIKPPKAGKPHPIDPAR